MRKKLLAVILCALCFSLHQYQQRYWDMKQHWIHIHRRKKSPQQFQIDGWGGKYSKCSGEE